MTPAPRSCPACGRGAPFAPVEARRDRVSGVEYGLWACPCGVVFSEPREAPPPDWYVKAAPLRAVERRPAPEKDRRFRAFLSEGLAPGRLLDVGCGDGAFLALAAARGWSVVGFDYEERMVALARARGVEAHAEEFASFCRRRPAREFDAITLFDVLEHTPEPAELLALIRPLLKPGGRLALTLPNARRPLPFGREEFDYPPHHFTRWTPEALRGLLERSGYAVERLDGGRPRIPALADHLYFGALMPALLPLLRRALLGRGAEGKTISEGYAATGKGGALADKARRQELVVLGRTLLAPLLWLLAAPLWLWYSALRRGDHVYALARKREA